MEKIKSQLRFIISRIQYSDLSIVCICSAFVAVSWFRFVIYTPIQTQIKKENHFDNSNFNSPLDLTLRKNKKPELIAAAFIEEQQLFIP